MPDDTPVDFRDLLNAPLSDFPDMPNLPGGKTFYGKTVALSAGHSRNLGTPLLHLEIRLTDAGADVPRSEMDKLAQAGFSLSDYNVGKDYYLTPKSMIFLRRFMTSMGFGEATTFREGLRLSEDGNPTEATQEAIRGLDVIVKTPLADDQGRVFLNNVDHVAVVKRG